MTMKLWLLRPIDDRNGPWEPWYDKCFGFVIRADSEEEARRMAELDSGAEVTGAWSLAKWSSCVELTATGDAEVVIKDEHWA